MIDLGVEKQSNRTFLIIKSYRGLLGPFPQ